MKNTAIQWTNHTWPIVNGCRRVSAGCNDCYAERLEATRLKHLPKYAGLSTMTPSGPRWTGLTRLWEPDLTFPLRLQKPAKIFVADMGDLFYEGVSDDWIDQVFAIMRVAYWHTFQMLTKRPERMREYLGEAKERVEQLSLDVAVPENWSKARKEDAWQLANGRSWPLNNVWVGTSVEDQPTADKRIPELLRCQAETYFVSYEPALGPADFTQWLEHCYPALGLIICGGESGPNARPCHVDWLRSVIKQTRGTPCKAFVKQLGARPVMRNDFPEPVPAERRWPTDTKYGERVARDDLIDDLEVILKDKKGGDPVEWPQELRVRELPE